MSDDLDQEAADRLAEMVDGLTEKLPAGLGFVVFLVADVGDHFEAILAASIPPEDFAPVLRRWLARYDAGEDGVDRAN
jgi:hypothetical protein